MRTQRLGFAILVVFLGAHCVRPRHVIPGAVRDSQRTIGKVTYAASLMRALTPSSAFRATMRVSNDSSSTVEIPLRLSCDLHVQLRASAQWNIDRFAWDSEKSPRNWECIGAQRTLVVPPAESRELFFDVPKADLNKALRPGTYDVFVHIAGAATPSWLYAGLVAIPIP